MATSRHLSRDIVRMRERIARKLKAGRRLTPEEAEAVSAALLASNFFAPVPLEPRDVELRLFVTLNLYALRGPPSRMLEKEAVPHLSDKLGLPEGTIREWKAKCLRDFGPGFFLKAKARGHATAPPIDGLAAIVGAYRRRKHQAE